MRHVGAVAGTFSPEGKLLNKDLWKDDTTFYLAAPADYYARFWHKHGLKGKGVRFPVRRCRRIFVLRLPQGSQYLAIAIGW